jgi:hypothetical protein
MTQLRGQERAQLLPTKEALTALKSDVTLESAILELCDNALDAWKRTNDQRGSAQIDIDVDTSGEETELIIRDDTGGVPRDEAAMLFGLGRTAKQNNGSIGTFGVGAKKSLVNLGIPFTIRSRHQDAPEGWRFRIDEAWFEDDEDWSVPLHSDAELPQGITEIRIEDLNYEWSEKTAAELRNRLGEAYNYFLSEEMHALTGESFGLTISVDGEAVTPVGTPDWAYSPFDGIYPRRYENITLEFEDLDHPVTAHITVGLLTKKDTRNAGTDFYIQKRKVISSARNEEGGFGEGRELLGKYNARHDRLRIVVELETKANGQRLPWDTQKSSIDKHNLIMRGTDQTRGIYNWLRRTAKAFYSLDADRVPRAFLETYDHSAPEAANGGEVAQYDYADRNRIISDHRPDTDIPEIKELLDQVKAHAKLRIRCEECIAEKKVPAYRTQLKQEIEGNFEQLTPVNTLPPAEATEHAHEVAGQINELARIHLENGVQYTPGLKEWQQPRYNNYFETHGGGSITTLESPPEHLPTTVVDIANHEYENNGNTVQSEPIAESADTVSEEQSQKESAELFLVFNGEDGERGAKLFDENRAEICSKLGLSTDVGDDVLWEEMRHFLQNELGE